MTQDELRDRILELFPALGGVEDWRWDETEVGEPIVLIEANASFTGLASGDMLVWGAIANATLIGVYRDQAQQPLFLERLERPVRGGGGATTCNWSRLSRAAASTWNVNLP